MNFRELKKIGDLNYFDRPYFSLFVNNKGELFLCNWVKMLINSHLWLVFRTDSELVLNYLNKKIDYVSFLKNSIDKKYYLVEIGANAMVLNTQETTNKIFLDSSLPSKQNLFFDEDFCEDEEEIRAFLQKTKPKILFEPISFHHKAQTPTKKINLPNAKTTNLYAKQSAY